MRRIFSLFVALLFVHILFASQTIVEHYSSKNGLAHDIANCVIQSSDGFLWIGTWHGLCRFDGKEIKTYNSRDKFQIDIPPRKIQEIIEDKYGNLWIKTIDHKLYIFDKRHEQFRAVTSQLPKNLSVNAQIIKVISDENGNFLLLTKNKDLLLAIPSENGSSDISILYKSDIAAGDSKLRQNILNETADFVNWIGMDFSILYASKGEKMRKMPPRYISEKISEISDTPFSCAIKMGDHLWLGKQDGMLFSVSLSDGSQIVYDSFSGVGEIQTIVSSGNSSIFVSVKNKGIYELDLQTGVVRLRIDSRANFVDVFKDSENLLWFIAEYNTVAALNPTTGANFIFDFHDKQPINESLNWQDGGKHGMFFLSATGLIYQINRSDMKMRKLDVKGVNERSSHEKFSDIFVDKRETLWLTSYDEGLFKVSFPVNQFHLFNPLLHTGDIQLHESDKIPIKTLFQDDNGDVWVSNRLSEIFWFDKHGTLKLKYNPTTFNIGNVYHIMKDSDGVFWFSTKGQGLVKAVPDKENKFGFQFQRFLYDPLNINSISNNDVYYTYQDSRGRIWVATFGGGLNLLIEEQGHVIFKHKFNSFSNYPEYGRYSEVRNIVEDNNNRIWVGSTDGLMSFDNNFEKSQDIVFETFQNRLSVNNNDIYYLYKDHSGDIWISIFGVGLNRLVKYDEKQKIPLLESYGIKEGLNVDVVFSIIEDNENRLWLSTERGISRFDKSGKIFRNFDEYDGLDYLKMEETGALKFPNGDIWFGSKEGVVSFNPANITENHENYPTYIVDIIVSNQNYNDWSNDSISVMNLDKIVLKHNQSMFSIEFAAVNFYTQNHISYKYILEGYEKEWHLNGKNRIASYTNVPHGKYIFKVQTMDETNPQLSSEKTLQIIVMPPWWKTIWAYLAYTILLVLLLYYLSRHLAMIVKIKNDIYVQQELSDLKIKFFTNVSHELRTPLTLIKGPISELRENENLSEKGLRYMDLMEKNTNHMLSLVNQILDFRKIENKKMKMRVSLFDLNGLVTSIYHEFFHLSIEKEIRFDYHLLEDRVMVWADREKIETVLRNIVSNAFKFTEAGGSVLLSSGLENKDNQCFIRVEDSGIGIPQNKLEEVFERFSQGEYNQLGTGIGLALSKELISLHHGAIQLSSVPNKGSIFTVMLPLGKEHFIADHVEFYLGDDVENMRFQDDSGSDMTEKMENENSNPDHDLPTILVVEDNTSLSNLLKMQLEDEFTVYSAIDGEDGFKKTHLYHPDVVITDQMMPNVTGLEMLEKIRNDFQISHIPVIILTAKNDDETRINALRLGANAYISKPFSKRYLVVRINQLLSDRKRFREKLWNTNEENQSENNFGEYLVEKDREFLSETYQIIENNIDNIDFNIDTISDSMGLSRSAYFKKLKSITGLAPVDLVKEVRLNKSVELMKSTDMTISEIAFAVGFRDSGYFGKCFRKKYQMTPTEYVNVQRESRK